MIALAALASAIAYVIALGLLVTRRAHFSAGDRRANVAAVVCFVVQRCFPQSTLASIAGVLACIIAIAALTRRSSAAGGTLAAIPLGVMLLVLLGPLFPPPYPHQFQYAEELLLCAAAPAGVFFALTSLLRRRRDFRTRSSP